MANKDNHSSCKKEKCMHDIDVEENLEDCSKDCACDESCNCKNEQPNENCTNDQCNCNDDKDKVSEDYDVSKDCGCNNETKLENKDYLTDLLRLQAEFDNYRKRMQTALSDARQDGFMDAIEKFLPAIDSFKMATDMITDKNTLMGIKFIEKGILDTLSKMGVNEIDCSGEFDPNFHQAIDVDTTSDSPAGSITKVAYKGFTYKDKVIRYAQVIVKK